MRLNKVDSVFPMYLSEQPVQVYSYTTKELPRNGILSLLEVKKEIFVDLKKMLILTLSLKVRANFFFVLRITCSDSLPI